MENIYYVYRHIRLDKNEPFYIGIGRRKNKFYKKAALIYKRAYIKYNRNNLWKYIVAKTNYEVEIIFESSSYDEIKRKEIEFIALYGRKNLNTGTLANLTDGGEGATNCKLSEKRKNSISLLFSIPCIQYDLDNNFIKQWKNASEAGNILNICSENIRQCCKGKAYHAGGFIWKDKNTPKNILIKKIFKNTPINQYNLNGILIKEWISAKQIEKTLNYNASSITKCCKKKIRTMYNFIWRYKNDNSAIEPIVICDNCNICKKNVYAKCLCRKCYNKQNKYKKMLTQ